LTLIPAFKLTLSKCMLSGGIVLGAILQGIFTPHWLQKFGITVKIELIITCVIFTAFLGGMADPNLTLGKAAVFGMIALTSQGIFESRSVSGASLEVDAKDIGQASGTQMGFRNMITAVSSKWLRCLRTDG
jgi:hypothetical protein